MASFVATYTGSTGQPRTLTVRAADLSEARKQLRRRGIRATEVKPNSNDVRGSEKNDAGGGKSFDLGRAFEKAPGVKEKAVFASKLAALVDAGVPIVRSLDLMATQ